MTGWKIPIFNRKDIDSFMVAFPQDERIGFDNQLSAIERTLKAKAATFPGIFRGFFHQKVSGT